MEFVSVTCQGEKCRCGEPAVKKVGEEIPFDDPAPQRHNLTAYVCGQHYAELMGPATLQGSAALPSEAVTPEMIDCPTCTVKAGRRCRNALGGFIGAYHDERIHTAMRATTPTAPILPAAVGGEAAEPPLLSEQQFSAGADHAPGSASRDGSAAPVQDDDAELVSMELARAVDELLSVADSVQRKAIAVINVLSSPTPETGLVEALTDAREAIASLDEDALGTVKMHPSADRDSGYEYPIRDELLAKIDSALSNVLPDEV